MPIDVGAMATVNVESNERLVQTEEGTGSALMRMIAPRSQCGCDRFDKRGADPWTSEMHSCFPSAPANSR